MRKKDLKPAIGIISIIAVVALAWYLGLFNNLLSQSSILGCDRVISNDPILGSSLCKTLVAGAGGETRLVATFDNNITSSEYNLSIRNKGVGEVSLIDDQVRFVTNARYNKTIYQYYVQTSNSFIRYNDVVGSWECRTPPSTYEGASLLGQTPIYCPAGCNRANQGTGSVSGCDAVYRKSKGLVVELDPTPFFEPRIEVSKKLYSSTNTLISENKYYLNSTSASNGDSDSRAIYSGNLKSNIGYPARPDLALYVSADGQTVKYVRSSIASQVESLGFGLTDAVTIRNGRANYETRVNSLLSTEADFGNYCDTVTSPNVTYYTSSINCRPTTPTTLPVVNFYWKTSTLEPYIPTSTPRIDGVSAEITSQAGNRAVISLNATNIGEQQDTFEFTVSCSRNINPISTTRSIPAGQTVPIEINYQGAGFIEMCNVEANSINAPQNRDTEQVRISIVPFCGKTPLNNNMQTVSTAFGCQFICPNYYGVTDVRETDCTPIERYDRCNSRNQSGECNSGFVSLAGYHCTGIGTYLKMNDYYDEVYRGRITPFVPEIRAHQYFIVTDQNVPKCQYVNEYGYENGQIINSFEYRPAFNIPDGQESSISTTPQNQQPATPNTNAPDLPRIPNEIISFPNEIILYVLGIGTALVLGYFLFVKKK